MASSPKETTTKTEPWDGAQPGLLKAYNEAENYYDSGHPSYYPGSTVADRSKETQQSLAQQAQYATNPANSNILTNAQNTTNNLITGAGIDQTGNNTLKTLLNGINVGSNPASSTANAFASGQYMGTAPGNSTLATSQNYTNPGVAATQAAMGTVNPNYTNAAMGQASQLGNFQNAATGLQTAQANSLASANNPTNANLQATASGANIGNNPYLMKNIAAQQQNIADTLKNVTNPGIDSQAAAAGRLGSGAYASMRNNADSTAAKAMSDVAVNALTNQYNTDTSQMLAANQQLSNNYNSDVNNQLNANSQLANTSNSQQSQIANGVQTYGNMQDSQQSARNAASNTMLAGAGQLGTQSDSQQTIRNSAANSANSQYNSDLANLLNGANMQNNIYQSGVQNQFDNAGLKQSAANSLNGNQNAQYGTQLAAAGAAGQQYSNGLLPSQTLASVGASNDNYLNALKQADVDRYNYNENQPIQNIMNKVNMYNGGGYSNQTTPVYSNTTGQILGGLGSLLAFL